MKIKGPKFSIPAFPQVAEALNSIVDWVESLPTAPEIVAGPNVLISSDENTVTIEAEAGGIAAPAASPCSFRFELVDCENERCTLVALNGVVNGLFAQNYDNIAEVATGSDSATQYIYLNAETDNSGITSMRYELVGEVKEISSQFKEGGPPEKIEIFVGTLSGGKVSSNYCNAISVKPEIAYTETDDDKTKVYYYWSIE